MVYDILQLIITTHNKVFYVIIIPNLSTNDNLAPNLSKTTCYEKSTHRDMQTDLVAIIMNTMHSAFCSQ